MVFLAPILKCCFVALLIAHGALAQSRSTCRFVAGIRADATRSDAFAENIVELGEFVCDDSEAAFGDASIDVDITLTAIARAVASVVSEIDYSCTLTGEATAAGNIRSQAQARARAAASAVAGVVNGKVECPDCMVRVEALVNATREVFVEATLDAVFELDLASRAGAPVAEVRREVERAVEERVLEALSTVVFNVRNSDDPALGCEAIGGPRVTLRDPNDEDDEPVTAECEVVAGGTIAQRIDAEAIASLGSELRVSLCDDPDASPTQMLDEFQENIATALVQAVTQVDVFCETSTGAGGEAAGCALGEATIRGSARATARSFAAGLVEAGSCTCNEEVSFNLTAVEEAIVEASATAFQEACSTGTDSVFLNDFQSTIEETSVVAAARVILEATVLTDEDSDDCEAIVIAEGCVETQICAADRSKCRGTDVEGTLRCCDRTSECRRITDNNSRCYPPNTQLPSFADGRLDLPTEPPCPET